MISQVFTKKTERSSIIALERDWQGRVSKLKCIVGNTPIEMNYFLDKTIAKTIPRIIQESQKADAIIVRNIFNGVSFGFNSNQLRYYGQRASFPYYKAKFRGGKKPYQEREVL